MDSVDVAEDLEHLLLPLGLLLVLVDMCQHLLTEHDEM